MRREGQGSEPQEKTMERGLLQSGGSSASGMNELNTQTGNNTGNVGQTRVGEGDSMRDNEERVKSKAKQWRKWQTRCSD